MSLDAIARAAQQRGSASERLFNGIVSFSKVVLQRQANIAVYFREEKHLSEDGLAEINVLRKRFDRVLSDLLEEGARAGEFTIGDIRVAALAIGGMVSWAYTWYQPDGQAADRRGRHETGPFRAADGRRAPGGAAFYSTLKPRLSHTSRAAGVPRNARKARASGLSPALITANG